MLDAKNEVKRTKRVVAKNPVAQILDEKNMDNVVLYDDQEKPIEFEQVAVIPLEEKNAIYAILIPVTPMVGVNEGEGVLFEIDEDNQDLLVVNDEETIDKVLEIYQALIDDDNDKGKK